MKKIMQRVGSPTPPFFRKLRNIGIGLVAASTAVLTAPVSLPVLVTTVATYLAVAGTVATTVSQLTISDQNKPIPAKARKSRKQVPK